MANKQYIGVLRRKTGWYAQVNYRGKWQGRGPFASAERAARVRDQLVLQLRVRGASLNFPEEHQGDRSQESPMPTMAQKKKVQEVCDYFRQHYLGRVRYPAEARQDITKRYELSNNEWYRYLERFKAIMRTEQPPTNGSHPAAVAIASAPLPEQPIVAEEEDRALDVVIPADIPEGARAAFGNLLSAYQRVLSELQAQAAESASLRVQAAVSERRVRTLKGVIEKLTEAV